MSYFPMFIELKNKPCLIVGGGRIAARKAEILKDFGAKITVVAPIISSEIKQIEAVAFQEKPFENTDLAGQQLVVAATDDKHLNHQVSQMCREAGIPVNAVDQTEDCSFIFPAYLKEGEVVAAFSSGGQSPVITQYLKAQLRPALTPHLGEIAACLGQLREHLRQCTEFEATRKKIYQELLQLALESEMLPSEDDIQAIIAKHREAENARSAEVSLKPARN